MEVREASEPQEVKEPAVEERVTRRSGRRWAETKEKIEPIRESREENGSHLGM